MKNRIVSVLAGAFRPVAVVMFVLSCVFGISAIAAPDAQPSVAVGVVAQRYPWNGMVDVAVKVSGAPTEGVTLVVTATPKGGAPIKVVRQTGVENGEQKVSFDANKVDALKGRQLKDIKITAKAE